MSAKEKRTWIIENDKFAPSVKEMEIAELYWIKQAQQSLPNDVQRKMADLNPVQDSLGLWLVVGRTATEVNSAPYLIPGETPWLGS